MRKCTLLLISLLLCVPTMAQTPWRTVDSLVKAKAYADAYTLLQQNYDHAKQHGRSYDLLRAAYSMAEIGKAYPPKQNDESLFRHTLPYLDTAERALCHTLIANIYATAILNRRSAHETESTPPCHTDPADTVYGLWCTSRLADSIWSHTSEALSNPIKLLKNKRIADYDYLTRHDTVNDYADLTLYEAVAYAAVHNIESNSLLFNGTDFVYSDSLYNVLCAPTHLATMTIPQGGTARHKLQLLKEVAQFLISQKADTASVRWQTLCRELRAFLHHYSLGWHRGTVRKASHSPALDININPILSPDEEAFFTYDGDSTTTMYIRIIHSISDTLKELPQRQHLEYALSQPVLHSFAVKVSPPKDKSTKNRYSFPSLPADKYALLVSDRPFPARLNKKGDAQPMSLGPMMGHPDNDTEIIMDGREPSVFMYTFAFQPIAIEPIQGTSGQGVVLLTSTGEPVGGITVTLRGKVTQNGIPTGDSIVLTTVTDSLGRFDFGKLMPLGEGVKPTYSTTYQGYTATLENIDDWFFHRIRALAEEEEGADTVVSFFLNAKTYRFSDTLRFTLMAQQKAAGSKANYTPVQHSTFRVVMNDGKLYDTITTILLTTDDMGWAEGSIALSQVLDETKEYNGNLALVVNNYDDDRIGLAWFKVEDYKLPTMSMTLETTSDTHHYGQPVHIEGLVNSRSGATVSPTTVSYTLKQTFDYANWTKDVGNEHEGTSFIVSSGQLPLGPDGSFSYRFVPVKYDYLPYRDGEHALYYFSVTATDPAGETMTKELKISVGDQVGHIDLSTAYRPGIMIPLNYNENYIGGLDDIYVGCRSLDNDHLAVPARLTIEAEKNSTVVWQGDMEIPDKETPLSDLVPPIDLPNGHLRFIVTCANPHLHPDTLRVTHLGFDAPMPLDSLTLFASVEKSEYHVGDTMRVRVGSATKVSALLLISRNDSIFLFRHLCLDKGFAQIALPVDQRYRGEMGVSVITYHHGQRIVGSSNIRVWSPRLPKLKLEWIEPKAFSLTPESPDFYVQRLFAGAPVHWRLRLTDSLGNPVQSALALTTYDDALGYDELFSGRRDYEPFNYNCRFQDQELTSNRSRLNYTWWKEDKQRPFFTLQRLNRSRRFQDREYYIDKPMVKSLLSVGTTGFDVLYCISSTIEGTPLGKAYNQAIPKGILRTDLSPYGPWFGNLHSDRDGIVDLRFNAPQRLARWMLDGVAMDRQGSIARTFNIFTTYRDIMLMPNVPPFLYAGDSTALNVRIDRIDNSTMGDLAVSLYKGTKAKGRPHTAALPAGASQAQFPLTAPRTLFHFTSKHRDYTLTISDPQRGDSNLDAQTAGVDILRHPRLHGNTYPLTQADYHILQSRTTKLFDWDTYSPSDLKDIFDSLYCAAVYHNDHAVDTLIRILEEIQLPSGGWPCLKHQTYIFNEIYSLDYLMTLIRIENECPHVRIPESFNIQRFMQIVDNLMFRYWKQHPDSKQGAMMWCTVHDHYAQYALDPMYYTMRDSLYANIKRKPDQSDILLLHRHGDTALAHKLAENIVQSSVYDAQRPELGRYWIGYGITEETLLEYIDIFEKVLCDTILADQVRQRIRYLAPTKVWYGTEKARLTSHGMVRNLDCTKELADSHITLTREVRTTDNADSGDSPYGQCTIRLTVTIDRPMSHLYLRSPYAACFASHGEVRFVASSTEKLNNISVKSVDARLGSVATQFVGAPDCLDIYIKELPAGTHTLEYTVTTDRTGRFHLPPATVQCLALPWHEAKKGLLQAATEAETIRR